MSKELKLCTKCNKALSLDEFYNHPNGKNGKQSICKNCKSVYKKKSYKNPDIRLKKLKANSEWLKNNKEKRSIYRKGYYQNNKKELSRKEQEYKQNNKEKIYAHTCVSNMIRYEKWKKPTHCSICNSNEYKIQAHHEDYTKPLEVIWLCQSCHENLHIKKRGYLEVDRGI